MKYFADFFRQKTGNNVTLNKNTFELKASNPLFFFNYKIELNILFNQNLKIDYTFSLLETVKVLIVLILFAAFFSKYSANEYLVAIAGFSVIFMGVNYLLIRSHTRNLIKEALEYAFDTDKNDFSLEQKQWLSDQNKCPACGFDITIYDKTCPDCGLKLRNHAPKPPFDVSGNAKRIKYHYK